jgi:hypothetical protein
MAHRADEILGDVGEHLLQVALGNLRIEGRCSARSRGDHVFDHREEEPLFDWKWL